MTRRKRWGQARYDDHEQGHGAPTANVSAACRTRGGDVRDSKLIVSMGGRRIFRHQVLCNQPRKRPIDPAPHVDFGKFFKLKPGVLAQIVVVRARGPLVRCQIAS
jgi:hypothetical protein